MGVSGLGLEGLTSDSAGGGGGVPDSPLILQGLGVVGAPELTFIGDLDTGIYSPAADQLGLVAGAVEIARASGGAEDQFIIGPNGILGSEALPSLAFGDGDTGFYETFDDTLRVTVQGTNRFLWADAGNSFQGAIIGAGAIRNEATSGTNPTCNPSNEDTDTGLGRPAADQLSLIAGGDEIARAVEVPGANQFILSPTILDNNEALPTLAFGDGDSGFFESIDDAIGVSLAGSRSWIFQAGSFTADASNGPRMMNEAATATNPTLIPHLGDPSTGIGANATGTVSIIATGSERVRITASINTFTGNWVAATGSGPGVLDEGASSTNPTLVPNQADPDTGIGRDTVDGLAFIAGGVSCMRVREIAAAPAVGLYTTTPIIQQTGVAVSAAGIHAACVAIGLFTA